MKASERRCVCGHDRSLHAWPALRSQGLGACSGVDCECQRFVTPGQRRYSRYLAQLAEQVRAEKARLKEGY
jgi:hypothetical protein